MTAENFDLDLGQLMNYAMGMFNLLSPIVVIIGGLTLGIGLIFLVMAAIKSALKGAI